MKPLVLYTSKFCPKCELARTLLKENHLEYSEIQDDNKALEKGIKETPCLMCGSKKYNMKKIISICKAGGSFE